MDGLNYSPCSLRLDGFQSVRTMTETEATLPVAIPVQSGPDLFKPTVTRTAVNFKFSAVKLDSCRARISLATSSYLFTFSTVKLNSDLPPALTDHIWRIWSGITALEQMLSLESFVHSTGGGFGEYRCEDELRFEKKKSRKYIFHQYQLTQNLKSKDYYDPGTGFGRISFPDAPTLPKVYLRVPDQSDPKMLLYFVENVWNLPRPKLVIGITGGALDFPLTPELEQVLNDLMQIARKHEAWLVTGGTKAGIMKYCGA